jgi:hypothetical protein
MYIEICHKEIIRAGHNNSNDFIIITINNVEVINEFGCTYVVLVKIEI